MKTLFSLCTENSVIYEICIFHGHIFRRYASGFIAVADENDTEAARAFGYIK